MATADLDLTEVLALAADIGKSGDEALKEARATTQGAALNIKRDMQQQAQGVRHAPALPGDISYETRETAGGIDAEIGPTTGDVGSLALLYYGNSKTGPRLPDPIHSLERELPTYEKYIAQIGVTSLE